MTFRRPCNGAYKLVESEVEQGRPAYAICLLVEESEALEAKSAVAEYERLRTQVFPHLRLGLADGQLHPAEKDRVMRQFKGRVGCSSQQSYCYLLSKEASATASERLHTLEQTTDGFALARRLLRCAPERPARAKGGEHGRHAPDGGVAHAGRMALAAGPLPAQAGACRAA